MSKVITSIITSDVKIYCDDLASEDVTSALSVYEIYCSAAKGLVTPAGVTESSKPSISIITNAEHMKC